VPRKESEGIEITARKIQGFRELGTSPLDAGRSEPAWDAGMAPQKGRGGWPVDLPCSRNARPKKALVERAQWETKQATLPEEKTSELGGNYLISPVCGMHGIIRVLEEPPDCPSFSQNAHDEAVLVQCAQ
jgi:hypothetical protein